MFGLLILILNLIDCITVAIIVDVDVVVVGKVQ